MHITERQSEISTLYEKFSDSVLGDEMFEDAFKACPRAGDDPDATSAAEHHILFSFLSWIDTQGQPPLIDEEQEFIRQAIYKDIVGGD